MLLLQSGQISTTELWVLTLFALVIAGLLKIVHKALDKDRKKFTCNVDPFENRETMDINKRIEITVNKLFKRLDTSDTSTGRLMIRIDSLEKKLEKLDEKGK